jgi:hypothetical protein
MTLETIIKAYGARWTLVENENICLKSEVKDIQTVSDKLKLTLESINKQKNTKPKKSPTEIKSNTRRKTK